MSKTAAKKSARKTAAKKTSNPFKGWQDWMRTSGRKYDHAKLMAAMVEANGEKPALSAKAGVRAVARQKAWVSTFSAAYHACNRHGMYVTAAGELGNPAQ